MQPQSRFVPLRAHSTPEPDMPPPPEGDPLTPPPVPRRHRPRAGRGTHAAAAARENALNGLPAAALRHGQLWPARALFISSWKWEARDSSGPRHLNNKNAHKCCRVDTYQALTAECHAAVTILFL